MLTLSSRPVSSLSEMLEVVPLSFSSFELLSCFGFLLLSVEAPPHLVSLAVKVSLVFIKLVLYFLLGVSLALIFLVLTIEGVFEFI